MEERCSYARHLAAASEGDHGCIHLHWHRRRSHQRCVPALSVKSVLKVGTEGLPRASYLIIGNSARSVDNRVRDTATLIAFQAGFGVLLSVAILAAAPQLTAAFVPVE